MILFITIPEPKPEAMRAQHLLCSLAVINQRWCATLAYVDHRFDTSRSRGSRCRGSFVRQRLQLHPSTGFGHTNHDRDNNGGDFNLREGIHVNDHAQRRRLFVQTLFKSAMASAALIPATARPVRAACLSGDIRTECVGVYKLPVDAGESDYVGNAETLKLYAPDIKWIPPITYPPNYADALKQLKNQRKALDAARELVAKGDIEETGLVFLDIIPKTTAAGITITKAFSAASNAERNAAMKKVPRSKLGGGGEGDADGAGSGPVNPSTTVATTTLDMRAFRIENALNDLYATLGEADILIGQGMRGELGVAAPAQIEILAQIADCRREYDVLLKTVPETLASLR